MPIQTTEKTHGPDGTKTISQINRELQDVYDGQPATARCAWCPWTFEGTAIDARDAFAFHRSSEHADRVNGASARELLEADGAASTNGKTQKWSREEIIAAIQRWAREHDGKPPLSTMWMKKQPGCPQTSTVINRFGSWSKGIAAAGFEKPTRGSRTSVNTKSLPVSPPPSEVEKPEPAVDPPPRVKSKPVRRARRAPKAKPPVKRAATFGGLVEIVTPGAAGPGSFIELCEQAAERHETAATAYRQIASGVRTLEELTAT